MSVPMSSGNQVTGHVESIVDYLVRKHSEKTGRRVSACAQPFVEFMRQHLNSIHFSTTTLAGEDIVLQTTTGDLMLLRGTARTVDENLPDSGAVPILKHRP